MYIQISHNVIPFLLNGMNWNNKYSYNKIYNVFIVSDVRVMDTVCLET